MGMSQAVRLCPELRVLPPDMREYGQVSGRVMGILHSMTPLVEQLSIDEAFLEVTERREYASVLAKTLQAQVAEQLGLPSSLGVATNKLVAKIATDVGKAGVQTGDYPRAIQVVAPGREAEFLAPLPVDALWGVGPRTRERLAEMGIHKVSDVLAGSAEGLARQLGKLGRDLYRQAQGLDERPVVTEREAKSISQETTFAEDVADTETLRRALRHQAGQVGARLRGSGLAARTVILKLRWADFTTLTRQTTPSHPVEDEEEYERPIEEPEPLSYGDLIGGHGGLTALLHAAREGHAGTVRALIEGGAEIDQVSGGDRTSPMLIAMINGHFDLAIELLEAGADPRLTSAAGATPLFAALNAHWAPKSRYPQQHAYGQQRHSYLDVMRRLLDAGVDPNARLAKHLWWVSYNFDLLQIDLKGATPFWRAAYSLDVEAMRLLVEYGADPGLATIKVPPRRLPAWDREKRDLSGVPPVPVGGPADYPIHAATGIGYGQGFPSNAHRYVPDGWLPAIRYLVEELGADVNQRDDEGYTPLHNAASRGDVEVIRFLVEHGADVTAVSRVGQTTADMANGPYQRTQPFPEAMALLESLGSKNNHNCVSC